MARPRISIIMVAYQMAREVPRTLQSLSPDYQLDVGSDDYEVIVVDNGSPTPIDRDLVRSFGPNFSCPRIDHAAPSPVPAINEAVAMSRGEIVGLLLDGARLVTPGLLKYANLAFSMYRDPTVATLAWHLGPAAQQDSIRNGYDQEAEDRLLATIQWPDEGYRLFEIATLALFSKNGFFLPIHESNAIFLRRSTYDKLGGYDESFDLHGGGFANLDFYKRACERPGAPLVVLLGEGSFHQIHGGVSTNVPQVEILRLGPEWAAQYERIRGEPWEPPSNVPDYIGSVTPSALETIALSARRLVQEMAERDGRLGALRENLAASERGIEELRDELAAKTRKLEATHAMLAAQGEEASVLRAQLTQILLSRSWRFTTPLRWFRALFRRQL